MIKRLVLSFALSCTLCAGQTTVTNPSSSTQSLPTETKTGTMTQSLPGENGAETSTQSSMPVVRVQKEQGTGRSKESAGEIEKQETNSDTAPPEKTRKIKPITVKSDFERFVEDAVGHPLLVFARELFDEVPSTFAPMDHIPVPTDYAIGPGDELLIRAWGKIDIDVTVTVDRNGQISLPRVGTMSVAGLRYEQLES